MTNTHNARLSQHHGATMPESIQPGEGEAVRYGTEQAQGVPTDVEFVGKAEARRRKGERANFFNVNRYRCLSNGQKG